MRLAERHDDDVVSLAEPVRLAHVEALVHAVDVYGTPDQVRTNRDGRSSCRIEGVRVGGAAGSLHAPVLSACRR